MDKNNLQEFEKNYPEADFKKTIYSFSQPEIQKIETLIRVGQLIEQIVVQTTQSIMGQIVQDECLSRVNAKNSPDTGVFYSLANKQFFVYEPRFWCSLCGNRKASYSYQNKAYCEACIDTLKKQIQTLPVVPEAKEDTKPSKEAKEKPVKK